MNPLSKNMTFRELYGNGACLDIQREAGVRDAKIVIALTNSDELNVFACLVAKKLGVKNTIARDRNPYYRKQIMDMQDELGISMIVNPEQDTPAEIFLEEKTISDMLYLLRCTPSSL